MLLIIDIMAMMMVMVMVVMMVMIMMMMMMIKVIFNMFIVIFCEFVLWLNYITNL